MTTNDLELKKEALQNAIIESKTDEILLKNVKAWLFTSEFSRNPPKPSQQMEDLVKAGLDKLEKRQGQDLIIPTGYAPYDDQFGGLVCGELLIFGGRPGMGKSVWLNQLAMQVSQQVPVLYFGFDQSMDIQAYRMLSYLTDITVDKILQQRLTDDERKQLNQAYTDLKEKHKLFLNDSGNDSISVFESMCEEHISKHGVKVILIDYLQLLSSRRNSGSREAEIGSISRHLKNIARKHNVAVVALSQLSRAVETRGGDKRPQLSDLRESGAIEQDADKVVFMYRAEYYSIVQDADGYSTQCITDLDVAKNKQGPTGMIQLRRKEMFTGFETNFKSSEIEFDSFIS